MSIDEQCQGFDSELVSLDSSLELNLAEPVVVRGRRLVLSEAEESEAAKEIDDVGRVNAEVDTLLDVLAEATCHFAFLWRNYLNKAHSRFLRSLSFCIY